MKASTNSDKRWLAFPILLVALAAGSAAVWLLWNWLMPEIFKLPQISYWQAMGLLVLSRLLVGGWGSRKPHHRTPFEKEAFKQKFMNMTDEEKLRFKEEWKQRCNKQNPSDN